MLACVNASGTSFIPPMVLYKGKNRKDIWGDELPAGSILEMTPKGYITVKSFCKFLEHFNHQSARQSVVDSRRA